MAQSLVKLTLESNDYERKLRNAKKQWDEFTKGIGLSASKFSAAAVGIAAVTGALKVATDAFMKNEQQLDEWGRIVKSSESLYSGFLVGLNNSDISGFLSRMKDIVSAAREAYNAIDELGTYNAFNRMNIADARANLTQSVADFRMGEGSADNVKKATEELKKELKVRQEKEWDAYIKSVGNLAAQYGVKADDAVKLLGGKYADFEKAKQTNLQGSGKKYSFDLMSGSYTELRYAVTDAEKLSELARKMNDTELDALQAMGEQAKQTKREIADLDKQLTRVLNTAKGSKSVGGGGRGRASSGSAQIFPEGSVAALTQEMQKLRKEQELVTSGEDWREYEQRITAIAEKISKIKNYVKPFSFDLRGIEKPNILAPIGKKTEEINLKTPLQILQEELQKATEFMNSSLDADTYRQRKKVVEAKERQIDEYTNGKKKGSGGEKLSQMASGISQMTGGISSIAGGIEQLGIELPKGLKDIVNTLGGIATIVGGISSAVTAAAVLSSIPFFANGGIAHAANGLFVPGHSYSGDRVPAMLNSGELILNKAQQGNIASQLSGGALSNLNMTAVVHGTDLILTIDNTKRSAGKGKMMTTRFNHNG